MLGRDAELSLVLARLLPGNVCTVTGPAGVGKTRFALALALARAEDHPWWSVDLRGVDSDDHVALAVADRLVGHADPHHGSTERVCAALRDSEGTLVLDSCEHLVSGVTDLIAKLQATALQLRLVVTSRRPLGIGAEVVHKLAPLPVPEATCVDADALARNEAVLLFAARAQLVKVDLALDASNLRDIGAIVRCLDGLPMAIELAAAQADVGTLAAIRRRIETHLESLVEDNAQLPSRSRSLLAAITGSVVLLDQDERRMLLSCSVFPGSFTTAGAASVSELDEGATYRLLVALVRQSLVSVDGDDTYKLLAPIRAYARSRAQDELLLPGLRRRHPDWVASVAWTAWAHSGDLRERQDLRELTPLLADARAALDWALEEQHLPAATQIAVAFSWVWTMQGLASEGLGHLLRVKALSDQMPPENAQAAAERAALLRSVGLVANPMGKLELARDVCSDAVALSVQHGDTDGAAAALLTLAVAQWAFGDLQGATSALDSGVDLTQSRPESWYFLAARVLRARTALDAGEPDAAALVGAAVDLTQESGDQHLTGLAMACQARLLLSTGDVEAAVLVAGEAFRVWRSINYREGEVMALNLLSRCSAELGETDQGQASAREALLIGRRAGHRGAMCDSLESFACNAAVAGRREQALLLLSVSERERERLGAPIPAGDRTHVESTKLALREALGDTVRLVLARARLIRFDELVEELSR